MAPNKILMWFLYFPKENRETTLNKILLKILSRFLYFPKANGETTPNKIFRKY